MITAWGANYMLLRARRNGRNIGNNTRLERRGLDGYAIVLHGTDVVTLDADGAPKGSYTLNSGGWRTRTTLNLINEYGPVRVYQERGVWYVDRAGGPVPFADGMVVSADGTILDRGDVRAEIDRQDSEHAIESSVREVRAHVAKHGLNDPGNDDTAGLVWEATGRDSHVFAICRIDPKRMVQIVRRYLRDRARDHTGGSHPA